MIAVVNMESLGISEYELDWTDLAERAGELYGLVGKAVQMLDPLADKPAGYVEWGVIELPEEASAFAVTACRVRGRAAGAMEFCTLGDEEGVFRERRYTIDALQETVERDRQELLARDVDFTAAAFSLEGPALEVSACRLAVERIQDWRR